MRYTSCLLAVALCLVIVSAPSGAMLMNKTGGGAPSAPTYTPLCGGSNPTCAYAYSTERQMVSTATTALQVYRSVDGTTQDVGFTGAGLTNTATVDNFCNAAVGGVISRNCLLSQVYDQSGNACPIFATSPTNMPTYMVDPSHQGLPRFQKVSQGSGALTFLLDSGGAISTTPTHHCTALTGPAQSLFFAGNSSYAAFSSGQFGLMEGTVASGPAGVMFAAFIGPSGYTYDHCLTSSPCGGLDTEAQGPQYNYTRTSNDDFIDIAVAPTSGNTPYNVYINNNLAFPNDTSGVALVTGFRMTWGNSGDHSTPGPAIGRSESFYSSVMSSGQVAALYSNETNFVASLTTGYVGPGDNAIAGNETSYSSGLSLQKVVQLQWLSQAFSLRKAYAGYEGPALNACQGQGAVTCKDIGWVNNTIDTATLSAFCGPVSGLNNCTVETWYNEALNQASTTNGVNTGIDAMANSTTTRPTIAWSGCGTTAITVCIATSPTNYFTLGGGITVTGGYTMSAVATRTAGTSASAILASVSTPTTFIGFGGVNTCTGSATSGGGASTVACNDNVVHSITVDAHTSPSASTITYADGVAGTANTSTIAYSGTGLGVGATAAGIDPCTCQLSEVLVYADAHNTSYNTALGSSGVALLRANQRAVFGF